jgi:myo-inositol-1(or 4)-monophosphatase
VIETSLDLLNTLTTATDLARKAGLLLREGFATHNYSVDLKSSNEVVTEYDRRSEAIIVQGLHVAFPDHHIVGEEGGGTGTPFEQAIFRWYVDPLDGTTNFSHGVPHFCVSIGLSGQDGIPLLGVIYDPMLDECFQAASGYGTTLNGQPVHISKTADLSGALVSSGFGYDSWTNPDNNTEEWANFVMRAQGMSRMGSAALDLAYVAAGRFDGYWEHRLNPWDMLAGICCVAEAGGRVTNYRGGVATNGLLHEQMLTVITLGANAPRPTPRR